MLFPNNRQNSIFLCRFLQYAFRFHPYQVSFVLHTGKVFVQYFRNILFVIPFPCLHTHTLICSVELDYFWSDEKVIQKQFEK